jgi:hypothetical protein
VYAKVLTINKGIDNVLLFEFINQNEKPVNITGSSFVFRVINTEGTTVLLEEPLVALNAATGRAKVTLLTSQLLTVLAQPAFYSITRASGNLIEPVFVDAQSGGRAPLNIVDSVLPQYLPSNPLTIPTVKITAQGSADGTSFGNAGGDYYWNGNPNGANYWNSFALTEYYSSFITPRQGITTIQMTLDGYTGTIKAQAAADYESIPYNVTESTTYYDETRTIYLNVVGWHPLLRVCFNNSIFSVPGGQGIPAQAYAICEGGVVTSITVQNAGNGYLAPPKISILGEGAGATAVATISAGVTGFNVLDGGQNYVSGTTTVTITPAAGDTTGSGATATAIISSGVITGLTLTTAGTQYSKPPIVTVTSSGAGTGADVTTNISGSIASITVTNGGSGYWLVPNAGINTPYYPVPPNNQGAMVVISTGYVVDLFYR